MATDTVHAAGLRKAFLWVTRLVSYLIYFYLIVVEIILFLGFFLLLFGANPSSGFTQWVYRNLDRAMAPFRGIFTPIQLGTTSGDIPAVFETSVLFAMIVYGILALVFSAFIAWLTHRLSVVEAAEAEMEARQDRERAEQQFYAAQAAQSGQAAQVGAVAQQVPTAATTVPGVATPPPPPPAV